MGWSEHQPDYDRWRNCIEQSPKNMYSHHWPESHCISIRMNIDCLENTSVQHRASFCSLPTRASESWSNGAVCTTKRIATGWTGCTFIDIASFWRKVWMDTALKGVGAYNWGHWRIAAFAELKIQPTRAMCITWLMLTRMHIRDWWLIKCLTKNYFFSKHSEFRTCRQVPWSVYSAHRLKTQNQCSLQLVAEVHPRIQGCFGHDSHGHRCVLNGVQCFLQSPLLHSKHMKIGSSTCVIICVPIVGSIFQMSLLNLYLLQNPNSAPLSLHWKINIWLYTNGWNQTGKRLCFKSVIGAVLKASGSNHQSHCTSPFEFQ